MSKISVLFTVMLATSSCSGGDQQIGRCSAKLGCANDVFIKIIDARCAHNEEKNCRRSLTLKNIFGDFERVYFVERLSARLDECTTIPVPKELGRAYTPLCQYMLFEKDGKTIFYLQGYCTSDVKAPQNRIGFVPVSTGFVSAMDAGKLVTIERTIEKDEKGHISNFYEIDPAKSDLVQIDPHKEKCIGM